MFTIGQYLLNLPNESIIPELWRNQAIYQNEISKELNPSLVVPSTVQLKNEVDSLQIPIILIHYVKWLH